MATVSLISLYFFTVTFYLFYGLKGTTYSAAKIVSKRIVNRSTKQRTLRLNTVLEAVYIAALVIPYFLLMLLLFWMPLYLHPVILSILVFLVAVRFIAGVLELFYWTDSNKEYRQSIGVAFLDKLTNAYVTACLFWGIVRLLAM